MRRPTQRRLGRERGSEAIEAAIGVPAFLLLVALIIAAGRFAIAQQAIDSAAADAARTASIARTQALARSGAETEAYFSLANQGLQCTTRSVHVDVTGFASPPGTPAVVKATVSCTVNLSDLAIPGLPGDRTITATMTSPIDTYRER